MTDHTENPYARFLSALPYSAELGMQLDQVHNGEARLSMDYDPRLIGDGESGVIHGGAVFALLDTCGGVAVGSHPLAGHPTATLSLRIDYMRSATPGQRIRAHAVCHHVTRSVAFVRATATDDNDDTPVATATGAFTVERKP